MFKISSFCFNSISFCLYFSSKFFSNSCSFFLKYSSCFNSISFCLYFSSKFFSNSFAFFSKSSFSLFSCIISSLYFCWSLFSCIISSLYFCWSLFSCVLFASYIFFCFCNIASSSFNSSSFCFKLLFSFSKVSFSCFNVLFSFSKVSFSFSNLSLKSRKHGQIVIQQFSSSSDPR